MRRRVSGGLDRLTAAGQPAGRRVLRAASAACLLLAVVLLGASAVIALQQPATKRPLPVGTVFSVPIATQPAPAPETAAAILGPRLEERSTNIATDTPSPEPTAPPAPAPTPSPSPTPPPSEAAIARLSIPRIKVDAPISFRGVDGNGVMQDPVSWNDVAYYTFTGRPGFGTGNNAVFAGHVDYIRHGPAVFWDLDKLKPGDDIDVLLQDGTTFTYKVTQMEVYGADAAPVDEILGETPTESVTLITCNGTFSAGHYNNRLVVRAERVEHPDATAGAASPGG